MSRRSRFLATALAVGAALLFAPEVRAQSNVRPAPEVGAASIDARFFRQPDPWIGAALGDPDPFGSELGTLRTLPIPARQSGFTKLELFGSALPGASFETGGGEVSTVRGGWHATVGERLDDEIVFAVDLSAEASFYDFDGAGALQAGSADPFNDVYDSRLGLSLMQDPRARTSWFSGLQLRLSGEDDAEVRDALSVGIVGGVRHEVDEDLNVSVGVAALSRLEDDPWIFPYLGFDWRVADRLRFVSRGSEVGAVLEISEDVELGLGAEYAIRQFRLNDDSPLSAGVVQDEEILGTLNLSWQASERLAIEVEGGVALWRELSSYNSSGVKLTELESDPTTFVRVAVSATF